MSALRNERAGFGFDGRTAFIEVPHSPSLWLPEFTVVFWLRAPGQPIFTRIVEKGGAGAPAGGFLIEDMDGANANFLVFRAGAFDGFRPLYYTVFDDRWHHIAFGYGKRAVYVYIDGALRGFKNTDIYAPTTYRMTIMRHCVLEGWYHAGLISDFRLYNRLISFAEYNMLYQGRDVRDGLVLHLDPSVPLRDDGRIQDLSGYGNHGIPYGNMRLGVYRAARTVAPARVLARAR